MNALKSITLATLFVAATGAAHAAGADHYGRGAPSVAADSTVRTIAPNIEVSSVQGRSSVVPPSRQGTADETYASRAAKDVQGRS